MLKLFNFFNESYDYKHKPDYNPLQYIKINQYTKEHYIKTEIYFYNQLIAYTEISEDLILQNSFKNMTGYNEKCYRLNNFFYTNNAIEHILKTKPYLKNNQVIKDESLIWGNVRIGSMLLLKTLQAISPGWIANSQIGDILDDEKDALWGKKNAACECIINLAHDGFIEYFKKGYDRCGWFAAKINNYGLKLLEMLENKANVYDYYFYSIKGLTYSNRGYMTNKSKKFLLLDINQINNICKNEPKILPFTMENIETQDKIKIPNKYFFILNCQKCNKSKQQSFPQENNEELYHYYDENYFNYHLWICKYCENKNPVGIQDAITQNLSLFDSNIDYLCNILKNIFKENL